MAEERVQRKLTTILAADVVGYSRLMHADEEATLKILGEYREIVDVRSGPWFRRQCPDDDPQGIYRAGVPEDHRVSSVRQRRPLT